MSLVESSIELMKNRLRPAWAFEIFYRNLNLGPGLRARARLDSPLINSFGLAMLEEELQQA